MDNNYGNMNDTNNTNGTNNRDYTSNVNNANTTGNASDAGVNFTMSGNPYNPDESQKAAQTNNTSAESYSQSYNPLKNVLSTLSFFLAPRFCAMKLVHAV